MPLLSPQNRQFMSPVHQFTMLQATVHVRDSLMVRMSACRVLDRGSIPRRGVFVFLS